MGPAWQVCHSAGRESMNMLCRCDSLLRCRCFCGGCFFGLFPAATHFPAYLKRTRSINISQLLQVCHTKVSVQIQSPFNVPQLELLYDTKILNEISPLIAITTWILLSNIFCLLPSCKRLHRCGKPTICRLFS